MAYHIRTKEHLLRNTTTDNAEYIPQLYVKLRNWNPPPTSANIEEQLVQFEKQIKEASHRNHFQTHSYTSLTPLQTATLHTLKSSKDFIIMPTDKNLGPAIMNYDDYDKQVRVEHLTTPSYQLLQTHIANSRLLHTKNLLMTTLFLQTPT